jgi:hypothetical protein
MRTSFPWSPSVDAFLNSYPEHVQEIALAARALLSGMLPGAEEIVDESAKVVGYGSAPGYKGVVCTLILSQTGAKIGIAHGAALPDPKHLMAGSGKIHRYVQLNRVSDLRTSGLRQLVRTSLAAWRRRNAAHG